MTAVAQRENRRKGFLIILGIIALGALLLLAAAALGYISGWDNAFGQGGAGTTNSGAEGSAANADCFLGLICFNANANADGNNANASGDGEGIHTNSN